MRARDSVVAWRDSDVWTDSDRSFGLEPRSTGRLTVGYYLLVPVQSEKELSLIHI